MSYDARVSHLGDNRNRTKKGVRKTYDKRPGVVYRVGSLFDSGLDVKPTKAETAKGLRAELNAAAAARKAGDK